MNLDIREFTIDQIEKLAGALALADKFDQGESALDDFGDEVLTEMAEEFAQATGIAEACATIVENSGQAPAMADDYASYRSRFWALAIACSESSSEFTDTAKAEVYLNYLSRAVVAYLNSFGVSPIAVFEAARDKYTATDEDSSTD